MVSETWVEVYVRCMDGEFFRGAYCPRDGHSNDTSLWVEETVRAIRSDVAQVCLAELARRGFEGDLGDLIVIEFSGQEHAPHWRRPEG